MARSPLTLAALAAAVLPGFDPVTAQQLTTRSSGEYASALVKGADGRELVVRTPRTQAAVAELVAAVKVTEAMTSGIRSLLPFQVPTVVGQGVARDGTPAVIFEYITGNVVTQADFNKNVALATTVGRSIGYIHQLPTSFASVAGLATFTSNETVRQAHDLLSRGRETGLLPASLSARWLDAIADDSLWQFTPTIVHGSLGIDRFVVGEDAVSGVLAWGATRVGDPAWDLHWLANLDVELQLEGFAAYEDVRQSAADPKIRQRAVLYSELELVRWLLHGREAGRTDIVDDAVTMMDRLIDTIRDEATNTVGQEPEQVLSVTQVESLLESVPDVSAGDPTAEVLWDEPARLHTPEPTQVPTPQPAQEPTPELTQEYTPIFEPAVEIDLSATVEYNPLSANDTETIPNPVQEAPRGEAAPVHPTADENLTDNLEDDTF